MGASVSSRLGGAAYSPLQPHVCDGDLRFLSSLSPMAELLFVS